MDPNVRIDRVFFNRAHCLRLVSAIVMALVFALGTDGAVLEMPEESEADSSEGGGADQNSQGLIRSKGTFAKLWNEQAFIGPATVVVPGTPPEGANVCLPGDFERHGAVLVAAGWLAREAPTVLVELFRTAVASTQLVLQASSSQDRNRAIQVLAEAGLSPNETPFLVVPTDTAWVRDYGPIFVGEKAGGLHAFDAAYDKPGRARDEAAGRLIADYFHVPTRATRLRWQGGNLLSDGKGLLVTTTQSINANIEWGNDVDTVLRFLREQFGVRQVVVLEHLPGERTGHVDMFACFTSSDTIVVGAYDSSIDPKNAARLDRNAARLAKVQIGGGRLNVVRVPMPTNQDGVWRSSTNVVFADGTLLVPVFPTVDKDRSEEALTFYRQLLPEWKVVGVDAERLAAFEGGLRCATLYVPKGTPAVSKSSASD